MQYHLESIGFSSLAEYNLVESASSCPPTSRISILEPKCNSQYHNNTHQAYNTPGSILVISPLINILQMLISLNCMCESLLNVEVNAVDQGTLVDDQLVELSVDCGQLVDGLDQILDAHVLLVLLTHLLLSHEHLKVPRTTHPLLLLGVQLNGVVNRALLISFQPLKVLLLLVP